MRRLPPPVRARACHSAYTRACACVRVPGYERHTRVCARANDLFLAGVVQPPDALFGATHGHATVRRLFLFSTSPASLSSSLLLSSPPPFPPFTFPLSSSSFSFPRPRRVYARLTLLPGFVLSISSSLFNFSSLLSRNSRLDEVLEENGSRSNERPR